MHRDMALVTSTAPFANHAAPGLVAGPVPHDDSEEPIESEMEEADRNDPDDISALEALVCASSQHVRSVAVGRSINLICSIFSQRLAAKCLGSVL